MRYFLSMVCLFCLLQACHSDKKPRAERPAVSSQVIAAAPADCRYEEYKKVSRLLLQRYRERPLDTNYNLLVQFIADSLVPCWYGTPWDFNGTTQTPGQGKIACGYFVTTVLRDAGFTLDRVKLAQCASEQLVTTTCNGVQRYSKKALRDFVAAIKKAGRGLYIVGLDNHTGFIYHNGKEISFIHAGYLPPRCALREPAEESATLAASAYRVVGKINWQ